MTNERFHGKIKFFNESKGFGFITLDKNQGERSGDIFIHVSALQGTGITVEDLYDLRPVSFTITLSNRGQKKECAGAIKLEGN